MSNHSREGNIEVFRTNIAHSTEAERLKAMIIRRFPDYRINFDIDDCDRIMRIVSPRGGIKISVVIQLAKQFDFQIDLLPDSVPVGWEPAFDEPHRRGQKNDSKETT